MSDSGKEEMEEEARRGRRGRRHGRGRRCGPEERDTTRVQLERGHVGAGGRWLCAWRRDAPR